MMAQKVREGVFRTVFLIYFILLFYRENCSSSTVLPGYFVTVFYLFRKIKMLTAICDKDTVASASGSTTGSASATASVILIPDTS